MIDLYADNPIERDKMLNAKPDKSINAAIFNVMRTLKKLNPGDTYLENYKWHLDKNGDKFFDYYHLLWEVGPKMNPKSMLEIGCRTGISICQLLASMIDYTDKEVVLFDVFNDGFISPALVKLNMLQLNIPTDMVEFNVGKSTETIPKYKEEHPGKKFDYVLVDGDHSKAGARIDLENVVDMVAKDGILIFDDIANDGMSLDDVWQAFKAEHKEEFTYNENYDGKGTAWAIKL